MVTKVTKPYSTPKQKVAAKDLIQNPSKPLKDVLIDAGYAPSVAVQGALVTQTRGFQLEMEGYGLTKELIASSLREDIVKKPQNRVGELALGAKILKMTNEVEASQSAPTLNIGVIDMRASNVIESVPEVVELSAKEPNNGSN